MSARRFAKTVREGWGGIAEEIPEVPNPRRKGVIFPSSGGPDHDDDGSPLDIVVSRKKPW